MTDVNPVDDMPEEGVSDSVEKVEAPKAASKKTTTKKKVTKKVAEFPGFPGGRPLVFNQWKTDKAAWEAGDTAKADRWR